MAKAPKETPKKKPFKTMLPPDLVADLQLVVTASGKTMSDFLTHELRKIVVREAKAVGKRIEAMSK